MALPTLWKRAYHFVREVANTYFHFMISRSAAGLSYYLVLSLFPLLLCSSIVLTELPLYETAVLYTLDEILAETVGIDPAEVYANESNALFFFISMTVLISSSAGAFRCLSHTAAEITGEKRFGGILGGVLGYLFSIILFLMIYASFAIMSLWNELLDLALLYLPVSDVFDVIGKLRYLIVFAVIFGFCYALAFLLQPKNTPRGGILPGALFSAVALCTVTWYFAYFMRGSTKYSLIYGSISSIVLLMIWLNLQGNILMLSIVINAVWQKRNKA